MKTPTKRIYSALQLHERPNGAVSAPCPINWTGNRNGDYAWALSKWESISDTERPYVAQAIVLCGGSLDAIPDYRRIAHRRNHVKTTEHSCGHAEVVTVPEYSGERFSDGVNPITDLSDWYELTINYDDLITAEKTLSPCPACQLANEERVGRPYYDLSDNDLFLAVPAIVGLSGNRTKSAVRAIRMMQQPAPELKTIRVIYKTTWRPAKGQIKIGQTNGRGGYCKSACFLDWNKK